MSAIGYVALFLALVTSLYSAIAYIIGNNRNNQTLLGSARLSLLSACGLVTLCVLILLAALFSHNFKIDYVASYTSFNTSFAYLFSALWAGNDGSLLLWAWLTSLFATVVILKKRNKNIELVPYTSAIMMLIQVFFLILLVSVANPFHQLPFAPADGRGLNPMLENLGMIFHPPALLAGYVGLTVPFAFAIAALLSRKLGNDWLVAVRRWMLLAWLLLGVGNIIGAWWAYVELGWGGYWAWDPVENAGLMPWLVATAFLHSIMIQRRKEIFKAWTMLLVILAFSLAIFGTFITRSGVLSSVHTYGVSAMGPFFIVFLAIIFLGSLGLLLFRKEELKGEADVDQLVSRESTFLLNNILLVGAALIIFVGTVFPWISEAIRGVRIEVGQSFFNRVNGPLFLAIILLAGICTLIGWRPTLIKNFVRTLLGPIVPALVVTVVLLIIGIRQWYAIVVSFICVFVFLTILYKWFMEVWQYRKGVAKSYPKACWQLFSSNRPRYGGYIVHLAIIVMAIGILGSSMYDIKKEASLKQGDSITVEGYTIVYEGLDIRETPDKQVVAADISVYQGSELIAKMKPEKYYPSSYEQPVSEVAIRSTVFEDLYIILAGWESNGTAAFTILVNPLVILLWIGGVIFLIGGLVAFWPGRLELPTLRPDSTSPKKDTGIDNEIEQQVKQLRRSRGMNCPKCGTAYQKGNRFCSRCGTALSRRDGN